MNSTLAMSENPTKIKDCFPSKDSFFGRKMREARENIKSGKGKTETPGVSYDEKGREIFDVNLINYHTQESKKQEDLSRHQNNPNTRLDECGFPSDRKDRNFILNHNFGSDLSFILKNIRQNWVYIYGDPGRGKTSIAVRAVWEMIRNDPSRKATFFSIGKWTDSLQVGKSEYLDISKLRPIVLIDDFDKFGKEKDYQIRQLLLLIEELKNQHFVIITSNHSRPEILKLNPDNLNMKVMLDRIRGKSVDMERFTGESYR